MALVLVEEDYEYSGMRKFLFYPKDFYFVLSPTEVGLFLQFFLGGG